MKKELEKLILLQKGDIEIAEFERALGGIPGQIDAARSGMEEKKRRLDQALAAMEDGKVRRRKLEQEAQAEADHMAKVKTKLPAVKTNKEYSALLAEIDAIKEKVSGIEDQELELMESLESEEREIPTFQAAFKEEESAFKEYEAKKNAEAERVRQQLEDARARREGLVETLDAKWVNSYDKVFRAREGQAVVPLKDNICQGCFQHILPQMVIDIKIGEKVFQCQHCSRFLYWPEESPETALPK
jgi:predicted  nucleic acid-binding Zn-ribbon protein